MMTLKEHAEGKLGWLREQLDFTGLTKLIYENLSLISCDEVNMVVDIEKKYAPLISPKIKENLEEAVKNIFGKHMKLVFKIDETYCKISKFLEKAKTEEFSSKEKIELTELLKSLGPIDKLKENKRIAVLCPWHKEKTPSCIIDWNESVITCLGCGKHASINEPTVWASVE